MAIMSGCGVGVISSILSGCNGFVIGGTSERDDDALRILESQGGGRRLVIMAFLMAGAILLSSLPLDAGELHYRDKLGRVVAIQTPVKRAAVLHMYDCLPPLKAWNQLSCLANYCLKDELLMAIEPVRVRRLADGMGSSSSLNMEKLLRLKPDVVLIWTSSLQQIEFMERRGLNVVAIFPESVSELYEVMEMLGRLFDRRQEMAVTTRRMRDVFAVIKEHTARIAPSRRQRALWISSRPTSVSGGVGLNDDLMNLIGTNNVASAVRERSLEVSLEQVIKWNPDVIFIWGNANYSSADILRNPQWRTIRAVREGRVYKAPHWSTWSPLVAPTALWMAVRAYPDLYRDVDLNVRVDRFFRDVYGVSGKLSKLRE